MIGTRGKSLTAHRLGPVLVVAAPTGPAEPARALAHLVAGLPAEPAHTPVVLDLPDAQSWAQLPELLREAGRLRLFCSRAGAGGAEAPARALAETLHTEVLAPDGELLPVPGGLFVAGGRWWRFRPSWFPDPAELRYPTPAWETGTPIEPWPAGDGVLAEPIPAGLWLHAGRALGPAAAGAAPVYAVPTQPTPTLLLGAPGEPPLGTEAICRLLAELPAPVRVQIRLAQHGPIQDGGTPVGQLVADRTGAEVTLWTDPLTKTWRPFATTLTYRPRTSGDLPVPALRGCRPPAPGLPEATPGTYRLTPGAVVEIVQSGLWIRPPAEPANGNEVRAVPWDAEWARVTIGTPRTPLPAELAEAAATLVARLDPLTRQALRLVPLDAGRPDDRPPAAPPRRQSVLEALSAEEPAQPAPLPEPAHVPIVVRTPEPPLDPAPAAEPARPPEPAPAPTSAATAPAPEPVPTAAATPAPEPVDPPQPPPAPAPTPTIAEPASAEAAPAAAAPAPERVPTSAQPAPARTSAAVTQPAPAPTSAAVTLPTPIPPTHHSTPAERDWLRRSLGRDYDRIAGRVTRLLAGLPGLRCGAGDPPEVVVADLVALLVYLGAETTTTDDSLRAGRFAPVRPFIACVVSGLRRLPAYRGAALTGATLSAADLPVGSVHAEPAFRNAFATPAMHLPGDTELVIWSRTARRTGVLAEEDTDRYRVVFPPGVRFEVLAELPAEAARPRTLLLAEHVPGQQAAITEQLRRVVDRRAAVPVEARSSPANPVRYALPFGSASR
ncbi:hypothetical protein M8C13_33795 [Crossiella sp. SN42]|uniref:hypothetical protein n=1 Tax=Crossiella sp. SN42 TaxID=2944808 RepID=UPI00207C98F8|nr:hypothetical protein [Crossiella sp. SN42]MCO1580741.1 hypothetical protein [Crossiella sp. SN42]